MLTASEDGTFSGSGVDVGWLVCGSCVGNRCGSGGGCASCGDSCLAGEGAGRFSKLVTSSFDLLSFCLAEGDSHTNGRCLSLSFTSLLFSCLRLRSTRRSNGSSPSDLSALSADPGLFSSFSPPFSLS